MAGRRDIIPGVPADTQRTLEQALLRVTQRLEALERKQGRPGIITSSTSALPGEHLNIEAPAAGLDIILPQATPALRNARVTLNMRNANPVRITSILGKVNGQNFVKNTAAGTAEAVCNGLDGWAVPMLLTPTGSAFDAEYVVGAAHASLPNARLATDSTEIDADVTTDNVISWALKTGSVVLGKLANLTGLSVLGRASNSAGVMAAITATSSRQALMSNSAGTAIGWRSLELADLPTLPTPDWSDVLNEDPSSGAHNPSIDSGQHLAFAGGGVSGGDVRGATALTVEATAGELRLVSSGTVGITAPTLFRVLTGGVPVQRLQINDAGAWYIGFDPGSSREVITSGGSGTPPTWSYPIEVRDSGSDQGDVFAFDFVAGTNINLAASVSSGVATITPSVDLSGVTYTAGDGIDLTGLAFSVDASDFAGGGLEDDGSNNLRTSAVTGAISRAAGATASKFAGIKNNGGALTARTNINFLSTAFDNTFSVSDDAANDELEVRVTTLGSFYAENSGSTIQTKFISFDSGDGTIVDVEDNTGGSGYINVSYDVDRADAFAWTGVHSFASGFSVNAPGNASLQAGGALSLTGGSTGLHLDSAVLIDINGTDEVTINGTNELKLTSSAIVLESNGEVVVQATAGEAVVRIGQSTIEGYLVLQAGTSSAHSPGSTRGMYWVLNPGSSATRPMFTSADDQDREIMCGPPADQVTIASPSGNLGTIDLGDMRSGGYVVITPVSADWQIEGWTCDNHEPGFWFHLFVTSGANTGTLENEDGGATGNNRMRCGGNASVSGQAIQATIYCISTTGTTKRWSVVANT